MATDSNSTRTSAPALILKPRLSDALDRFVGELLLAQADIIQAQRRLAEALKQREAR